MYTFQEKFAVPNCYVILEDGVEIGEISIPGDPDRNQDAAERLVAAANRAN